MAKSQTRKQKKGMMTIPQLRKSFDHMERYSTTLLHKSKGKDMVAKRKAFQKEWLRVFKRPVDDKAADAYLLFESKRSGSRKHRQNGGAALSGAPLDYTDRPGLVQEGPYAAFPAYLDKGLDAYATKFNQDSISSQCGHVNTTPKIPGDMGSNQVGGRRNRSRRMRKQMGGFPTLSEFATALSFRPLLASSPTTSMFDAQMAVKGQALPPSPYANTANPGYMPYKPIMLNAAAATITRDLGKEITS